jgi:hypothetical protein
MERVGGTMEKIRDVAGRLVPVLALGAVASVFAWAASWSTGLAFVFWTAAAMVAAGLTGCVALVEYLGGIEAVHDRLSEADRILDDVEEGRPFRDGQGRTWRGFTDAELARHELIERVTAEKSGATLVHMAIRVSEWLRDGAIVHYAGQDWRFALDTDRDVYLLVPIDTPDLDIDIDEDAEPLAPTGHRAAPPPIPVEVEPGQSTLAQP